jgi:hypothetical protein
MNTLSRQKLEINKTRSNILGWRGQFTPEFKPLEFQRFSNCGEFATIGSPALETTPVLIPSNSRELKTRPTEP